MYAGLSLFIIVGPYLYVVVCVVYAYNLALVVILNLTLCSEGTQEILEVDSWASIHKIIVRLTLKPRADITRSPKRGISGLTKRTLNVFLKEEEFSSVSPFMLLFYVFLKLNCL